MGRFASPAQRCKLTALPTAVFIGLLTVIIFVFKRLAIIGVTLAGLWIDRTEQNTLRQNLTRELSDGSVTHIRAEQSNLAIALDSNKFFIQVRLLLGC